MDTIDKINYYLSKKNKTGADLSRALGLSSGAYSQWNTKKTKPSKSKLPIIAEYLEIPVEALYPDENEQERIKKSPATMGGEMTDAQKEAWALIQSWDDAKLKRFIAAAKAMLGE